MTSGEVSFTFFTFNSLDYCLCFHADVLSNLTTLRVLDISGNVLSDKIFDPLEDRRLVGHLPNLTVLEMSDNRFTSLPIDELVLHRNLQLLNVKNNRLLKYNPELTEMIKQGLDVEYAGRNTKNLHRVCCNINKHIH